MSDKPKRKRGTLIDWLVVLGILGVFSVLLYQALVSNWSRNGIPSWMVSYERWEKRQIYEWGHWWRRQTATSPARSSYDPSISRIHAD